MNWITNNTEDKYFFGKLEDLEFVDHTRLIGAKKKQMLEKTNQQLKEHRPTGKR